MIQLNDEKKPGNAKCYIIPGLRLSITSAWTEKQRSPSSVCVCVHVALATAQLKKLSCNSISKKFQQWLVVWNMLYTQW